MVVTFGSRKGPKEKAYRKITRGLQSVRQWIARNYEGTSGEKPLYLAMVEQHKNGWPHVNLCINWRGLCLAVEADWQHERQRIKDSLLRCGFGMVTWVEMVRDPENMAAYLAKRHLECDEPPEAGGRLPAETAKTTQAPVSAPARFRRLRASRGLLPPAEKNIDISGELLQYPLKVLTEPFTLYEDRDKEAYHARRDTEESAGTKGGKKDDVRGLRVVRVLPGGA